MIIIMECVIYINKSIIGGDLQSKHGLGSYFEKQKGMIVFSKDMEIGIGKIDSQHKELINRINAVSSMGMKSFTKEETQKTLDMLSSYVMKHFADEENLQKQSGYPKFAQHKELHSFYLKELQGLKREFAANGTSPQFTMDLNKSIINWIVKHIKSADVEFSKFYLSRS